MTIDDYFSLISLIIRCQEIPLEVVTEVEDKFEDE